MECFTYSWDIFHMSIPSLCYIWNGPIWFLHYRFYLPGTFSSSITKLNIAAYFFSYKGDWLVWSYSDQMKISHDRGFQDRPACFRPKISAIQLPCKAASRWHSKHFDMWLLIYLAFELWLVWITLAYIYLKFVLLICWAASPYFKMINALLNVVCCTICLWKPKRDSWSTSFNELHRPNIVVYTMQHWKNTVPWDKVEVFYAFPFTCSVSDKKKTNNGGRKITE